MQLYSVYEWGMPNITQRDAVLTGLGAAVAVPALTDSASNATAHSNAPVRGKAISGAAKHKCEMITEETRITLVGTQAFNTLALGWPVLAQIFPVRDADEVEHLMDSLAPPNQKTHGE